MNRRTFTGISSI